MTRHSWQRFNEIIKKCYLICRDYHFLNSYETFFFLSVPNLFSEHFCIYYEI
ncbi:hypothetical protein FQR65_LT06117 [Abscondita terminalis]|nr:hypothetical protein FQR65_LT06117 [Abscondita terminalis]